MKILEFFYGFFIVEEKMDERICVLVGVVSGHSDVMCDVLTKQERRTNSSCVYYCTIVGTQRRTKEAGESLRQ